MVSVDLVVSFAAAARHASFAGAARELGLSSSAVAKNVARLESQLGVRLFHRTTRRVTLTQEGESLQARCQRILEDIESLETDSAAARAGPRGTLRIDVPIVYGRQVVLPVLAGLAARHSELRFDVRFSDQMVDIVDEGLAFDEQSIWTCASPAYIRSHGEPASPDGVSAHACLLFRMPSTGRDRPWQFRSGKRDFSMMPQGRLRLGDGEALVQAATAGLGLVQVPSYMVESHVKRGRLVEVLQQYRPAPVPVSLVYPSNRHLPLRVRALADALKARRSGAG